MTTATPVLVTKALDFELTRGARYESLACR